MVASGMGRVNPAIKLIVGLGNPGERYEGSPHNFGFAVIDRLGERHSVALTRKESQSFCGKLVLGDHELWLIKPQTFMNLSGVAVREWLTKQDCSPRDLLVVADELDLPWGSIRIRQKGGPAGHHGLESIIGAIGSQDFPRVRIGVRPDHPIGDMVEYLLSPVRRSLRQEMHDVIDRSAEAVEVILNDGLNSAMNRFNQRKPPDAASAAEGKN
jgi:peptidyl-tRNA hydrolase, PTH1 family